MTESKLTIKGTFTVKCKQDYTAMGQVVFKKGESYKVNDRGIVYEIYDTLGVNHLYEVKNKEDVNKFKRYFEKV